MIINRIFCSGQTIDLATGETYTLKTDEVFINENIYKKKDLEITTQNIFADNNPEMVKVGIRKRDGIMNLPATFVKFNEWEHNGNVFASLSDCVENITNCIYFNVSVGDVVIKNISSAEIYDLEIGKYFVDSEQDYSLFTAGGIPVLDIFSKFGIITSNGFGIIVEEVGGGIKKYTITSNVSEPIEITSLGNYWVFNTVRKLKRVLVNTSRNYQSTDCGAILMINEDVTLTINPEILQEDFNCEIDIIGNHVLTNPTPLNGATTTPLATSTLGEDKMQTIYRMPNSDVFRIKGENS